MVKKPVLLVSTLLAVLGGSSVSSAFAAGCGPFTDVPPALCSFVSELYYLGISAGTSPTTFSPEQPITRGQAAVFVAKALDTSIRRTSRRAALGQWWTTQGILPLAGTDLPGYAADVKSDGTDVWVSITDGSIARVRASDGKLLETRTGMQGSGRILAAMGKIFEVNGSGPNGTLYMIDPSQSPGAPVAVTTDLGSLPLDLAFDGSRIWTANLDGSVSIVTPGPTIPWAVTTVDTGLPGLWTILWDGSQMWVTQESSGSLYRLTSSGTVAQTIVLSNPGDLTHPVFDGTNLWVPDGASYSVYGVRPSTGQVVATLTVGGFAPTNIVFDGERFLVTSLGFVSLFRASDLAPLGDFPTGIAAQMNICSDGLNFWIVPQALTGSPQRLFRF